jgi:hypothetical protein
VESRIKAENVSREYERRVYLMRLLIVDNLIPIVKARYQENVKNRLVYEVG